MAQKAGVNRSGDHARVICVVLETIDSFHSEYSKFRSFRAVPKRSRSTLLLKGSLRWKGCIVLFYYSVGDSQPYMLAVRLPAYHVRSFSAS